MKDYKYYAFISYKREDEEWAKWLQNKLEYFKLPVNPGNEEYIRPVFRDITDLRPGCLPERIREALDNSKYLIAVCSHNYSKSKWCDEEVRYFKETGRIRNVIPFIIAGNPYSNDDECFPPTLSELHGTENEILGVDVRTLSSEYALVQIVATMFGVEVDSIWGRYLRDEEEKKRRLKEQNDHLLSLQSRITAAKAEELINNWPYDERTAGKLMLEVLPHDVVTPDRPWVREAEYVLRKILHKDMLVCEVQLPQKAHPIAYCEEYIAAIQDNVETTMDWETQQLIRKSITPDYSIEVFQYSKENVDFLYGLPYHLYGYTIKAAYSGNNKYLAFLAGKLRILEIESGMIVMESSKTIDSESQRETLKWSQDNRWLACSNDNLIELFDLKINKEITIERHSEKLISLAFDKTGRFLVSVGFDREVKIWDIQDECREYFRYKCPHFVSFASYDAVSKELLMAMDSSTDRLTAIGDINRQGRNIIRQVNVETKAEEELTLHDSDAYYIKNIIVLRALNLMVVDGDGKICLYDRNTGMRLDVYADAHKVDVNEDTNEMIYIYQNKIKEHVIPSQKELLLKAQHEFGSIELSEDVKYRYFIR